MNKKLISFISCVLILATTALWPRSGVNLFKQVDTPFACEKVVSDQRLLMDAAEDALLHFKMKQDKCKIHSTLFSDSLISTADTRKTLQFIVDTARADRKTGGHR